MEMEKIQERALRFIYNDHSSDYESLLLKSELPTLKDRRLRIMALETFIILNNQDPAYLHNLVNFKANSYSFSKRTQLKYPR